MSPIPETVSTPSVTSQVISPGVSGVVSETGAASSARASIAGKQLRIYVNNSPDEWEISENKVLLGHNLRNVAPTWVTLAPMGFCVAEV